ncbi:MAG: sensor domain-containing diguanylate cyclase [Anaerolineales bacterium]|nr:sensor domain-containing diguanylate cyclase [Anaerolineales bacterium]
MHNKQIGKPSNDNPSKQVVGSEYTAKETAERRDVELKMLGNFADTLNKITTLQEVLQSGLETGVALLGASTGWIILVDEFGSARLAACQNSPASLPTEYYQEFPPCDCLKQLLAGSLTAPSRITTCDLLEKFLDSRRKFSEHISLPLHTAGRVIGMLNLVTPPKHTFTNEESSLLQTIGDQLAVAIERARLLDETHEAFLREQRLTEVTRTISSALDLGVILRNIVNLSVELVGADTGGLGLLIPDSEKIVSPYYLFNDSKKIKALRSLPLGEELARQMIETGKPVFLSKINTPSDTAQPIVAQELIAAGVHGVIGAPIVAGETRLGALVLYSLSSARRFSERYLSLVDAVGRQAGVAIQNSRLYEEIQQLAATDPLTGLYNRRHFYTLASHEFNMARRFNQSITAIMVDIDYFKRVNDTYGHLVGDIVLQNVANRCNESLRQSDILCRYGGEEFVILMIGTTLESALQIAERLRKRIADTPIETEGKSISITVSLGVAALGPYMHPVSLTGLDILINRADQALFTSKQNGRNRVTTWEAR